MKTVLISALDLAMLLDYLDNSYLLGKDRFYHRFRSIPEYNNLYLRLDSSFQSLISDSRSNHV